LLKKLRSADIKARPPSIVLSSEMDANIEDAYYELGADYVFRKPVDLKSFRGAIVKALKKNIYT